MIDIKENPLLTACFLSIAIMIGFVQSIQAQPFIASPEIAQIALPTDNDEYSDLVQKAEYSNTDIDFKKLRFSYLNSNSRKKASLKIKEISNLHKNIMEAMEHDNVDLVMNDAIEILSINYLDLMAHKALRQSCMQKGNTACSEHEHYIEFGLLNSIMGSGNGKSCGTGWEVVSIDEEYFILGMQNLEINTQSLIQDKNACDKFDTTTPEGGKKVFYFNINKLLQTENNDLMNAQK